MSQEHQTDAKQPGEFCVLGRRKEEIPGGVGATKSEVIFWWKIPMTILARWIPRKASPTIGHTFFTLLSHQFSLFSSHFYHTFVTNSFTLLSHFLSHVFHTCIHTILSHFFHTSFTLLSHLCHNVFHNVLTPFRTFCSPS